MKIKIKLNPGVNVDMAITDIRSSIENVTGKSCFIRIIENNAGVINDNRFATN